MTRFWIDVLDSDNNRLGAGPISNPLSASEESVLDESGQVSAVVPATDTRTKELVDVGTRFRIVTENGARTIGLIRKRLTAAGQQPTITLQGPDLLSELVGYTSGWFSIYRDEDTNTVVLPNIISGTGWSLGSVDAGLGNYAGILNGMSRLAMIQKVREMKARHIRLGSTVRTLDFGAFGADSGVILTNVDHHRVAQEGNTSIAIVDTLERAVDNWGVVNRLTAWGAGEDDGYSRLKVTLQDVPVSDPRAANIRIAKGLRGMATTQTTGSSGPVVNVVSSAGFADNQQIFIGNAADYSDPRQVNIVVVDVPNGTQIQINENVAVTTVGTDVIAWPQYYIEDAALYAVEPREDTIVWPEIDVVDRGSPNPAWVPAARALYDRAAAHLNWFKQPQTTYTAGVMRLPDTVRVGDKVRLRYKGVVAVEGGVLEYVNIDTLLWVLRITRNWSGDGKETARLALSTIDRQRVDDAAIVAQTMGGLDSLKIRA
jgi:hypothetical protein